MGVAHAFKARITLELHPSGFGNETFYCLHLNRLGSSQGRVGPSVASQRGQPAVRVRGTLKFSGFWGEPFALGGLTGHVSTGTVRLDISNKTSASSLNRSR